MSVTMKSAGFVISVVVTFIAMLALEATCTHALVVEKEELLPSDITESNTDWLEQEAIFRLLKSLHSPNEFQNFASSGTSDSSVDGLIKRGSSRAIDHREDRFRYLAWCRKMRVARCYV
ncbi:hypothetical protein HOLleu_34453 [Holothuria leucospilota]|uniref:Uncharacterized protein n=1 Tax=Holothuria leucospilota TaxID=206669 RepID=A0A9Q0YPT1_HOLLE|nr:hypothetical protein HOLleu_34453 [Holothuria leucospilota]